MARGHRERPGAGSACLRGRDELCPKFMGKPRAQCTHVRRGGCNDWG